MSEDKKSNTASIFQALRYSGENFFLNKQTLNDIREESDKICDIYQKKFQDLLKEQEKTEDQAYVDKVLFRPLNIEKPKEFDYERRNEITKSEEDLIKKACEDKNFPLSYVENIKYSLGYKTKDAIFKKPCVAVVGQTKAGKSSLINSILQQKVVPQKVSRQTARVTYVTHCQIKFVAHMQNSKLTRIELEEDVKQEDVDLTFDDRNKAGKVSVEIRVGTPNPIVQNGFDIVDSPGLNENPALNDLCVRMEKSLLPLLIYVVEGRNGLTQTDIDDITQIKSRTPQLKIIYFTTKLARSKFDRIQYLDTKLKKGFTIDQEMPGESDKEVAERRLEKVLKKMKIQTFLPTSASILDSRDFHGADIWAVNELRIHEPDKTRTECDEFNLDLMKWFEESLMLYLKDKLESPLKEEIKYIQSPLEDVLEKSTSVASEIAEEKTEKQQSVNNFRNEEQKLYENQIIYTEETLRKQIPQMIKKCKVEILKLVEEMKDEDFKSVKPHTSSSNTFENVKETLINTIAALLDVEIKASVTKFMVEKEQRLKTNLRKIVQFLSTGKHGSSSFEIMLKNRLFYEYELYVDIISSSGNAVDESSEITTNSKSVKHIEEKIRSRGVISMELLQTFRTKDEKLDQADQKAKQQAASAGDKGKWKQKMAERIIDEIDFEKFLKTLCDLVGEEFEKRHRRFVDQLNEQEKFLNKNLKLSEDEKLCVKEFAEQMGVQYAIALHVKTSLFVTVDPLRPSEFMETGGQAAVRKVHIIGQEEPIVLKQYDKTFVDFKNSPRLTIIAMEIYYSSRLDHSRCLKLLGIHFEKTSEGWKFNAYYPYLKRGSMKAYLETKKRGPNFNHDLKERLELCCEVAEGIQFLHKLHIVHRDINLKNILVRDVQPGTDKISKVEAVIADYGLAKSFGFIEHTERIGTPLYRAPELLNKHKLMRESYSFSVDVFSFGMCAWQLLSYKLTDDYDNYYPRFAIECEHDEDQIEKLVMDGKRPEEREKLPPSVTNLLCKCWAGDPNKRPSFLKTLNELPHCFDIDDVMIDQTIVDALDKSRREVNI